ncbi:MAG: hypothetical protein MMC23_002852 [Stictis urceolatum]|nr:hypothetical protein [Stictis urceolata]
MFSSLPFLVTFLFVATVVFQRLFPLLSGEPRAKTLLFSHFKSSNGSNNGTRRGGQNSVKRISAITFSTTIALAAVLAELILCEISDTINPAARGLALKLTIILLLALLILVIPSLEINSIITSLGWRYTGPDAGRLKLAWTLHLAAFAAWMSGFWFSGQWILGPTKEGWVNATTEHVGVIGISLMALLSGFASVSAPYQSFIARNPPVSETSLARKQAGLESINEMLSTKRSRLRALEQKLSRAPSEGLLQKAMGTFRGNSDKEEKKSLEMEIWGLENMAVGLASQHSLLLGRWNEQQRSKTARGRLIRAAAYIFSVYCLYRIITTTITFIRRHVRPSSTFVGSDPINNILALLVKTYDSHLDRQAWTRQISFLLSGIMLCASISSVLQTFHFFSRYLPGLLKAAQANLPLLVAQICATYVISVALLLRGIMPGEVVSDRLKTLGGTDMMWVDGWFEEWFLGGVGVTVLGVWLGKKIAGDDWDEDDEWEAGKEC